MEEESKEDKCEIVEKWNGICVDDGTGRNVFYISNGQRSRLKPDNFEPEYLPNGEIRYYFRGACIRCKSIMPQVVLSKDNGKCMFCFNLCIDCCIATTPGIDTVSGHGQEIYDANLGMPLTVYVNMGDLVTDPHRDDFILHRAIEARKYCQIAAKFRRNKTRYKKCKIHAVQYNVTSGKYLSWGFDERFDEYYGEVDEETGELPDGYGVKFYADETVYVGGWLKGKQHTVETGLMIRPSGIQYQGTWVNGRKHGRGVQSYLDGSIYTGEFANGFEHGRGSIVFMDGSKFEGRFRFGRRDGPGVLVDPTGKNAVKKHYRDKESINTEKAPFNLELDEEEDAEVKSSLNPMTLLKAATEAAAKGMLKQRSALPCRKVIKKLSDALKPVVMKEYFAQNRIEMLRKVDPKFEADMVRAAFTYHSEVSLKCLKLKYEEVDSLLYFEGANTSLEKLSLVSNKLDASSIAAVAKHITIKPLVWPLLSFLDLSYNVIDISTMQTLTTGIANCTSLRSIHLAGCSLHANTVHVLCAHLTTNSHVKELNLAFNSLEAMGAISMATVIELNHSLTSLNLRRNGIGYQGGIAIAEALRSNYMIRTLCLVDNAVGEEAMAQISGRLRSTLKDVITSVRASETDLPAWYAEDRFSDWKPRLSNVLLVNGAMADESKDGEDGMVESEEDPATDINENNPDDILAANMEAEPPCPLIRDDDERMVVFTDNVERPSESRLPPNMPPIPVKRN